MHLCLTDNNLIYNEFRVKRIELDTFDEIKRKNNQQLIHGDIYLS